MKLLVDAGNTRIKWALVSGDDWLRSGVVPADQADRLAQQFAGMRDAQQSDIQQIWVSNVAGEEVAQHLRDACAGLNIRPDFVTAREAQCGVRNGYSDAGQLGGDRWAALIAAWHLVRGGCLVVNCGTATTIDALSGQGKFIGGLILPGVELMQNSLVAATARLKQGQLRPGQGECVPFPLNTADALYSGAIQASCGAIQRQHALLDDACPDGTTSHSTRLSKDDSQVAGYEPGRRGNAPVILSGGAAGVLQPYLNQSPLNLPLRVVDNLVLQGLLLIAQESGA